MALTQDQLMKLYGGASLGSGLYGLFGGGKNPADVANKELNKIPGQIDQYYDPYIQAGKGALPSLQDQYSSLLGSPGQKLNEIGSEYQQSPGLNFAIQQALQGAGHAAAAGGMAGSPEHQQQNMQLATDLANQDYNNWLGQATGLYGQGLTGEQGLAAGGLAAGGSMADQIAQQLAQKAAYKYKGQEGKNTGFGSALGNIGGGLAAFGPELLHLFGL